LIESLIANLWLLIFNNLFLLICAEPKECFVFTDHTVIMG
jgi:hypothetical protein